MTEGQEMFYNFFMANVVEGKEVEAEAFLKKGFEKQAEGTFDAEYFKVAMPKYLELVKPAFAPELKSAMEHYYAGNLE